MFSFFKSEIPNLAVLIDADNIRSDKIPALFEKIDKIGKPVIKRAYGNTVVFNNFQWKTLISKFSIKIIHQFQFVKGKNSTDIALVIEAMDILYRNPKIRGFCIVSTDSDFSGLAARIRENGLDVYGFGNKNAHISFRNSCTLFQELDGLFTQDVMNINCDVLGGVTEVIKACLGCKGVSQWVKIAELGSVLKEKIPNFQAKDYGFKKLGSLVESLGDVFEIKVENNQSFVRMKDKGYSLLTIG